MKQLKYGIQMENVKLHYMDIKAIFINYVQYLIMKIWLVVLERLALKLQMK